MELPDGWPALALRLVAALAVVLAAGCGGDELRRVDIVLVAPPVESGCGPPAGAQHVDLFALGDFVRQGEGGPADAPLAVERFPLTTRALELEVLGAGGTRLAIGRTGTLDVSTLSSGSQVPILLGPPRGFCQVGRMVQPRRRPSVAPAGGGVLVVGGLDSLAGPVGVAEWYSPATGSFELVPDAPFDDLRGASAVALDDGRVLIAWKDGFQLYDPGRREFGVPTLAQGVELHSYGLALRLADGRVLVAGGCDDGDLDGVPPCAATRSAAIFDPAADAFALAPALGVARADGAAWLDGDGHVLFIGGYGEDGAPLAEAELWEPGAGSAGAPLATGVAGASAPLPAGGWIVGFAPAGAPAGAAARLIAPLGGAGGALTAAVARAGATLTSLDDGAVLVVGGVDPGAASTSPEVELYRAHAARFQPLPTSPEVLGGRRREHAAIKLDDGSVLVLGGLGAGDGAGVVRGDAWIYRPDLTGPWSSLPVQIFGLDGTPLVVPFDAAAARVEPGAPEQLVVSAQALRAPLGGWAVLAGPRYADLTLSVTLSATAGAAVLLDMTSAGDYLAVLLEPGQPARVHVVASALLGPLLCAGDSPLAAAALASPLHALRVERHGASLRVSLDAVEILACDDLPTARGAAGVGIPGASGELRLGSLEAVR